MEEENEDDGFVITQTGQIGKITGTEGGNSASFTNVRAEGGLVISKSVNSVLTRDKSKEFTFKVQMYNVTDGNSSTVPEGTRYAQTSHKENGVDIVDSYYVTGEDGYILFPVVEVGKEDDTIRSNTFTLKDGEVMLIKSLPVGAKYVVTEIADDDFSTTGVNENGVSAVAETNTEGKVTANTITDVILKNSSNLAEYVNTRKPSELIIKKNINSTIPSDETKMFTFTVKLYEEVEGEDEDGNPITTKSYLTADIAGRHFDGDNGAQFVVSAAQTDGIKLEGLPSNVKFEIVENPEADSKFQLISVTVDGTEQTTKTTVAVGEDEVETILATGETDDTKAVTVAFTNERTNARLDVQKKVESLDEQDKSKDFKFTVLLNEAIMDWFDITVSGNVTGETVNGENTIREVTNDDETKTKQIHFFAGKTQFMLQDGAELIINSLPIGVTYTVIEEHENDFTTTYTGETGTIVDPEANDGKVATAVFTNTRKSGELAINKIVKANVVDNDQEFRFKVTFTEKKTVEGQTQDVPVNLKGTVTYYITTGTSKGADQTWTLANATNVIENITLKHDQTITIKDLPAGVTYTVEEETKDGYTTVGSGTTGKILVDDTATAYFTNTKQEGGLIVSKSVDSDVENDRTRDYQFKVVLTNEDGTPATGIFAEGENEKTFGEMKFEKKTTGEGEDEVVSVEAVFSLNGISDSTHKTVITAAGLPEGLKYTITETAVDGMTTTIVSTSNGVTSDVNGLSASGVIAKDKTASAAYTNSRSTGMLEIDKAVISDVAADQDKDFTFTVELKYGTAPLSGTYTAERYVKDSDGNYGSTPTATGKLTFDATGKAVITLHSGEKIKLTDLPVG